MLLPSTWNQHLKGTPKALMGVRMWDAQGWGMWMPKGEEKVRRREGMGALFGGRGLLVGIL